MASCRNDETAKEAVDLVRLQLMHPDDHLQWASYESIVDVIRSHGDLEAWATHFAGRYLPGVWTEAAPFPLG